MPATHGLRFGLPMTVTKGGQRGGNLGWSTHYRVVSNVMQLTDVEAKNFWPVYETYLEGLEQINRNLSDVIQSYVFGQRSNSLTEDVAKQPTDQFLAAQEREIKLRKSDSANLAKVVPGKTVARALQLENKIRAVAWYGLSSQIPLVRQ